MEEPCRSPTYRIVCRNTIECREWEWLFAAKHLELLPGQSKGEHFSLDTAEALLRILDAIPSEASCRDNHYSHK